MGAVEAHELQLLDRKIIALRWLKPIPGIIRSVADANSSRILANMNLPNSASLYLGRAATGKVATDIRLTTSATGRFQVSAQDPGPSG